MEWRESLARGMIQVRLAMDSQLLELTVGRILWLCSMHGNKKGHGNCSPYVMHSTHSHNWRSFVVAQNIAQNGEG